jgi:energy-coupling factor transporter ATP-binding protein EcfA2
MNTPVVDQVVEFYNQLFNSIFSTPFRPRIAEPLKRRAVLRQVDEASDAASQSLTRFFVNQRLDEQQVAAILDGFSTLGDFLKLGDIANPNITPEAVVEKLLVDLPCPPSVQLAKFDAVYRVSLHSVVQVLMIVGPVMAEWQKLNFSSTFELPRRVINRLNQISDQLAAYGFSGEAAADERFELTYRDYLLQRFYRVEAGTVRMTTNLNVDVRELFVMPRVLARPQLETAGDAQSPDAIGFMDLVEARKSFGSRSATGEHAGRAKKQEKGSPAIDQIKQSQRTVIIGAPGSGKSTFLEWLQLKLAAAEEELILGDQQAIPLMLRVRQLYPLNLPLGGYLIEKATASKDRAALMPLKWIDRQMKEGRVIFLLDGLDETEPELCKGYVIPWLAEICNQYPDCQYVVSSRPVGYPPGALRSLGFVECDLLDFSEDEITQYARHWCTSVRLAQNEPEDEVRRDGAADGDQIVSGFKGHPYIHNLARNPLMLSAICLVNYFEGGQLPKDRAVLYKLCVEGLLHHWDQRRGIHSEYMLDDKLRSCREVALSMQAENRAEFEDEKVLGIFAKVLNNSESAARLLEHIRYRTGLLIERRPKVFAFAHLTFQEYLAARAVHESNRLGIDGERLAREHADGRWNEVIALYCGLAPAPATREMIESLIAQPDTAQLGSVLAEAYLSAGQDLSQDLNLRRRVLERIAIAPYSRLNVFERFPMEEVAPIANSSVGRIKSSIRVSEAFYWLRRHSELLDMRALSERFREWYKMNPYEMAELIYLLHRFGPDNVLEELASDVARYSEPGPDFGYSEKYSSQGEIAFLGLLDNKDSSLGRIGFDAALLQFLRTIVISNDIIRAVSCRELADFFGRSHTIEILKGAASRSEIISLMRQLAHRLEAEKDLTPRQMYEYSIAALKRCADMLEGANTTEAKRKTKPSSKTRAKSPKRRKKQPDGGMQT